MKYVNRIGSILAMAFAPIRENWAFFVFMYVLGCICQWVEIPDWKGAKMYELTYWELFFDLYVLCLLLTAVPRKFRKWVKGVLYVVLYGLALVDMWCWVKYSTQITPTMLMLVGETDSREASEMLGSILSVDTLFSGVGWILLLILLHVLVTVQPFLKLKEPKLLRRVSPLLGVVCVYLFVQSATETWENKVKFYRLMQQETVGKMEQYRTSNSPTLYEPVYRLVFSIRANTMMARQLGTLIRVAEKARVDSCSYESPTIVLIIGESYSKHHSQQYGYFMPTTPRQIEREKTGLLVRFTDVVAPWNLTSYVFKNVFSTHVVGQEGEWCDYPLFPELFRKAGYRVTFLTNQFLPKKKEEFYDFSGGFFLNDPTLSEAQFDIRNEKTHVFDSGLLDDYDAIQKDTFTYPKADHNLLIFHLIGQHMHYRARCPNRQKVFKAEDYKESRPELPYTKRRNLSYYDNAVLYNDSIVDQIIRRFEDEEAIIVYMPDHGEEIYEGNRNILCRNHTPKIDYDLAHYEFEIPFWIYCSHKYAVAHPEIYKEVVGARNRRLMTDALPHLLLYLAGISAPEYHEEYNVLSPNYQESRPRLIKGGTDYDQLRDEKAKQEESLKGI